MRDSIDRSQADATCGSLNPSALRTSMTTIACGRSSRGLQPPDTLLEHGAAGTSSLGARASQQPALDTTRLRGFLNDRGDKVTRFCL